MYSKILEVFLAIIICLSSNSCEAVDMNSCTMPLGMESRAIPNSSISASSSYALSVGPHSARLNQEVNGGAWCPKGQIEPGVKEYLQVDLLRPRLVTAVATQGRHYSGKGQEYTEEYILEYWRPGMNEWKQYSRWDDKTVFGGNSDTDSVVEHRLTPLIHATKIRIVPHSLMRRTVCLRLELYGCLDDSGVISYSAPEPSNEKGDHIDKKYDGWRDPSGYMNGGLGGLTDGQIGGDFFSLDMGYAKGNGWIAWKNSSFSSGFMELAFEFDNLRNISQIDLFTNNYYSRDVQVFSTAVIYFSIGGRYYNGEPVVYFEKEDKVSQKAKNVTINIHYGRIAKFIRIRLYFCSEWIMLSEVYFQSELVYMNITEETEQKSFDHLLDSLYPNDTDGHLSASNSTSIIVILLIILISVLLLIFVPIVFVKKSNKYSAQSTSSILRNTFNFNIKDIFLNLNPPVNETNEEKGESPQTNRISIGRRRAAAETTSGAPHTLINNMGISPGFISNTMTNYSLNMNPTHIRIPSFDLRNNTHHSPSKGLSTVLDHGITSGYSHGYIHNLDIDLNQDDSFCNYNMSYGAGHGPRFDLGLNFENVQNAARPTLVTAISPESHRGRTVISLAPNKYGCNPKNLPNILQDGIHIDHLNGYENEKDDYYRFLTSNHMESNKSEIPLQRFMTLHGASVKKKDEIEYEDNTNSSVFCSHTQMRDGKINQQQDYDNKERAFSLSDLKKIHAKSTINIKFKYKNVFFRPGLVVIQDAGAITVWNISPAFKKPFPEVDIDFNIISMNSLHLILKIGSFGYQEISIYETKNLKLKINDPPRIVQVKTVKIGCKDQAFKEYLEELKYLGSVDHPSLSCLIGLVTNQSPPLAVFEYTHAGDLYQHLRKTNQPEQTRLSILLSIILQICSGMKYLEARDSVHKDLAARNILIFPRNRIKITDTAMCSPLYADHYYMQDDAKPLPIRWLSWECTLLKRYTCPGSVWSFGITMWEILSLCQYFPYEKLSVNDIVKLAEDYLLKKDVQEIHPKPTICPEDLYKIMLNCWERKSKHRPTFMEIYTFLKSKYIDLVPIDDDNFSNI